MSPQYCLLKFHNRTSPFSTNSGPQDYGSPVPSPCRGDAALARCSGRTWLSVCLRFQIAPGGRRVLAQASLRTDSGREAEFDWYLGSCGGLDQSLATLTQKEWQANPFSWSAFFRTARRGARRLQMRFLGWALGGPSAPIQGISNALYLLEPLNTKKCGLSAPHFGFVSTRFVSVVDVAGRRFALWTSFASTPASCGWNLETRGYQWNHRTASIH